MNVPSGEAPTSVPDPKSVLEELDRILHAPSFRTSKRSQQFLTYVVQQALDGRHENLKERSIGVAVFDRAPAYDTSQDATVRVAAVEVRKRLAQCYSDGPHGPIRIVLPAGSYAPEFHVTPPDPLPAQVPSALPSESSPDLKTEPARTPWTPLRLTLISVALLLVVAAVVTLRPGTPATPFDDFWHPLAESNRPVVICMSHPVVFLLSDRAVSEYAQRHNADPLAGPFISGVDPKDLRPGDLVASPDQYVGAGDAHALGLFVAHFGRLNRPAQMRIGNELSFADLRAAPVVLIGAYSNRWTMQSNATYRFGFDHFSVVDHSKPGQVWKLDDMSPDFKSKQDYAIVSRIFQSYTGQMAITAAGITNAGTQAAAEFLTNPASLNSALANAPAGWQKKNVQLVLHCKVIGRTPGPAEVVASHYW